MNEDIIEFEGKRVSRNKNGFYKCPFKCHNPEYPAPKWKTKEKALKHLEGCCKRPSYLAMKKEQEQQMQNKIQGFLNSLELIKPQAIEMLDIKIGETFFYTKSRVLKDTHEKRGNRFVRVRYEQVLRFEAVKEVLSFIDFDTPTKEVDLTNVRSLIKLNGKVRLHLLCQTYEEARKLAEDKNKLHEEARNFASMVR